MLQILFKKIFIMLQLVKKLGLVEEQSNRALHLDIAWVLSVGNIMYDGLEQFLVPKRTH